MTATNTAFDPPPPPVGGYPVPPPPKAATAGRRGVGTIVIGSVLLVIGFLIAASGGALLAVFGAGQVIGSGEHPVSTRTAAVVADLGRIQNTDDFRALTGSPTLSLSAENVSKGGVFVGIGRTADVERYLAGVPTERVDDLELTPFRLDTTTVEGTASATAPAQQNFWVASSESSRQAAVNWRMADGSYELVVMNADGSPGLVTSASVGVALPNSTGLWFVVLIIGASVMVIGGALVVVGISSGRRR